MPSQRFESLRERLLRAGIAPGHVQRYLGELQDHYEDARREELEHGATDAAASEAAWARLGTEEILAQGMLARPELRSRASRHPLLVFGLGPALLWLGAPVAIIAGLLTIPEAMPQLKTEATFIQAYHTLCFFYTRVLPVLLGTIVLAVAASRRLPAFWPLVGAGAVDVLAGTLTVYSFPGQLGITSSLLPWLVPLSHALGPRDPLALGAGLLKAAGLLALSVLLQQLLSRLGRARRQRHTAAA